MNDFIQNAMVFINEHTIVLIGICVFLILVLIGYLIDNSVKSKRVRKDIKNASQVPDNIKDEIIKEANIANATQQEEVKENINEELSFNNESVNNEINNAQENIELNLDTPNQTDELKIETPVEQPAGDDLNTELNLDTSSIVLDNNSTNEDQNLNLDVQMPQEMNLNTEFNLDVNSSSENNSIDISVPTQDNDSNQIETSIDPDLQIMQNANQKSEYKNDKKLSEILAQKDNLEVPVVDNDIFSSNETNITINNDIKKDDVQIENSQDNSGELDRIMRKLSSMNNNTEEDSYTNIF